MRNKAKKVLSLVLSLSMVLSLVCISANATYEYTEIDQSYEYTIGDDFYFDHGQDEDCHLATDGVLTHGFASSINATGADRKWIEIKEAAYWSTTGSDHDVSGTTNSTNDTMYVSLYNLGSNNRRIGINYATSDFDQFTDHQEGIDVSYVTGGGLDPYVYHGGYAFVKKSVEYTHNTDYYYDNSYVEGSWYQCTDTYHNTPAIQDNSKYHFAFGVENVMLKTWDDTYNHTVSAHSYEHVYRIPTLNVTGGTFKITVPDTVTVGKKGPTLNITGGTHAVYVAEEDVTLNVSGGAKVTVYSINGDAGTFKAVTVSDAGTYVDLGGFNVDGYVGVTGGTLVSNAEGAHITWDDTVGTGKGALDQNNGTVELTGYTITHNVSDTNTVNSNYAVHTTAAATTKLTNCKLASNYGYKGYTELTGGAATLNVDGSSIASTKLELNNCSIIEKAGGTESGTVRSAVYLKKAYVQMNDCYIVSADSSSGPALCAVSSELQIKGQTAGEEYFIKDDTAGIYCIGDDSKLSVSNAKVKVTNGTFGIGAMGTVKLSEAAVDVTCAATNVDIYGVFVPYGSLEVYDCDVDVTRNVTADVGMYDGPDEDTTPDTSWITEGIFMLRSAYFAMTDSTVNVASLDVDDDNNTAEGNQYYDNTGVVYGVNMYFNNGNAIVKNSTVTAKSMVSGGNSYQRCGAYGLSVLGIEVTLENNTVTANAVRDIKAIAVTAGSATIANNTATADTTGTHTEVTTENNTSVGMTVNAGTVKMYGNTVAAENRYYACGVGLSYYMNGVPTATLYDNTITVAATLIDSYAYGVESYVKINMPATYGVAHDTAAGNVITVSGGTKAYGVKAHSQLNIENASKITAISRSKASMAYGVYAYNDLYIAHADAVINGVLKANSGDENTSTYEKATRGVLAYNDFKLNAGTINAYIDGNTENAYLMGVDLQGDYGSYTAELNGGSINAGFDGTNYKTANDSKCTVVGVYNNGMTVTMNGGKISTYGDNYSTTRGFENAIGPFNMLGGEIKMLTNRTDGVHVHNGATFNMGTKNANTLGTTYPLISNATAQYCTAIYLPAGSTGNVYSGKVANDGQHGVAISVSGGELNVNTKAMPDDFCFIANAETNDGTALIIDNVTYGQSTWNIYGRGAKFTGATALNVSGTSDNVENVSGGTFVGKIEGNTNKVNTLLYPNHYIKTGTDYKTVTNGEDVQAAYGVTSDTNLAAGSYTVVDAEWELYSALKSATLTGYKMPCDVTTSYNATNSIDQYGAIDINGTKALNTNGHTLTSELENGSIFINVGSSAKLTLSGNGTVTRAGGNGATIDVGGKLVANTVTVNGTKAINATGTIDLTDVTADYLYVGANASSTISGGSFDEVHTGKSNVYALIKQTQDWFCNDVEQVRTVDLFTDKDLEKGANPYTVKTIVSSIELAQNNVTTAADGAFNIGVNVLVGLTNTTKNSFVNPKLTVDNNATTGNPTVTSLTNNAIVGVATTDNTNITIKDEYGNSTVLHLNPVAYKGGGSIAATVTYDVTCGTGVTADKTANVLAGSKVTVTVSDGYENVVVKDAKGNAVTVTNNIFTMPESNVTVSVSKKAEEKPTASFTDVAEKDWFADAVNYVYEKGMMNGTTTTTFAPNASTTRGMITTILARLDGKTITSTGSTWYADGQAWAVENGISDGTNPTGNITREQLAAMLYRYAALKKYDVTAKAELTNADASSVSSYAVEAMQWAVGAKIVGGDNNGLLNPTAGATRAEVATMLMRFCEAFVK